MLRTLRSLATTTAFTTLTALLAAAIATPVAAAGPRVASSASPAGGLLPTADLRVTIGSCLVEGLTRPNTTFTITHRASSGTLKSTVEVTSDDIGSFSRSCPGSKVAGGDRLALRLIGDTTVFKQLTIPALTLVTDRVNDRVRGTAKGVASVGLGVAQCAPLRDLCLTTTSADVPVNPLTHAFAWQVPADINGLTQATLRWSKNDDEVTLVRDVAHLVVRLGSSRVSGTGPRVNASVTIALARGGSTTRLTRRTDKAARFSGSFSRDGRALKVKVGDRLTAGFGGGSRLTIRGITLQATVDGATGTCFKNRPYSVTISDATGAVRFGGSGLTDDQGRWGLGATIQAGWRADAWCANAAGDVVRISRVVN